MPTRRSLPARPGLLVLGPDSAEPAASRGQSSPMGFAEHRSPGVPALDAAADRQPKVIDGTERRARKLVVGGRAALAVADDPAAAKADPVVADPTAAAGLAADLAENVAASAAFPVDARFMGETTLFIPGENARGVDAVLVGGTAKLEVMLERAGGVDPLRGAAGVRSGRRVVRAKVTANTDQPSRTGLPRDSTRATAVGGGAARAKGPEECSQASTAKGAQRFPP